MQSSSRFFNCLRCHVPVVVCQSCDHGQRYCANGCSKTSRNESLRRAAKKYQSSRAGGFNIAARQRRFRERKQLKPQKVT